MIAEERLREMIKNNEKIYICSTITSPTTTYSSLLKDFGALDYCITILSSFSNSLYESEEDYEFAKNFKNIEKKEVLNLPTWEEVEENFKNSGDGDYIILLKGDIVISYFKVNDRIYDLINIIKNNIIVYTLDATKENWFKICERAKKLFLGEKIDE